MESLSLNLTNPVGLSPQYWISLEQQLPEDLATHEEAAELMDTLFEIAPCNPGPEEEPPETAEEEEQNWAEKIEKALEKWKEIVESLRNQFCGLDDDCFLAEVKIARSHQDKRYTLLLPGGELIQTTVGHVEQIVKTVKIENARSVTGLLIPADQPITAEWQGSCYNASGRLGVRPEIMTKDGNVYWDGTVTGVIKISFPQPYEIALIKAEKDATVTAIGYRAVDEIDLEEPPKDTDEEAEKLCWQTGPVDIPDPDGDCYIMIDNRVLCNCTKKDSGLSNKYLETASCPADTPAGSIIDEQITISYVNCGERDKVNDPEYYKDVCCEPPPGPLPACKTIYAAYAGKGISPERRRQLEGMYDGNVNIITVGPKRRPCGTLTKTQDVSRKNCCDFVLPIRPDPSNPTEITSGGTRLLKILDGIVPFTWQVSGSYTFQNGLNYFVGGREVTVHADDPACETCLVKVNDKCTRLDITLINSDNPLSLTRYGGITGDAVGEVKLLIEGGVSPYIMTTSGIYTEFSNGLQEIELLSPGVVVLSVDVLQRCEGNFTVNVSDACADFESLSLDPGDILTGQVCMQYVSGYGSLLDWILNDGPVELTPPRLYVHNGLEFASSGITGFSHIGTYWMFLGSEASYLIISPGAGEGEFIQTRYRLIAPGNIPEICDPPVCG